MANIQSQNSNYVVYKLYSEIFPPITIKEPGGWEDDNLKLDRHKTYKGIFFSFTGGLEFSGQARDYINNVYDTNGVTAKLILEKQVLRDNGEEVKFMYSYSAFADFLTKKNGEAKVTINFNSFDLAETIKSHESDEIEIERETDIDGSTIDSMDTNTFTLKGRQLSYTAEHILKEGVTIDGFFQIPPGVEDAEYNFDGEGYTPKTTMLSSSGDSRNASVDDFRADDYQDMTASNMFFVAKTIDDGQQASPVNVQYEVEFEFRGLNKPLFGSTPKVIFSIGKYVWDADDTHYKEVELPIKHSLGRENNIYKFSGYVSFDCKWDEGLALRIRSDGDKDNFYLKMYKENLTVNSVEYWDPTPNTQFIFNHDLGERLTYILTGNKNSFYSTTFGRTDHPRIDYKSDGKYAFISQLSGLWARGFNKNSSKYKSLTTSFKKWFDDSNSVLNIGLGIDNVGNQERVRVEDLKFFFQEEVVIRLPNQIYDVNREVDDSMFFSGITTGYKKGGDYTDDQMGLDEPNISSSRITPVHVTEKKYIKESETRADQYGLEQTRRKPQSLYPEETTQRDNANWWLDLKRAVVGQGFEEAEWWDRLYKLPTGIQNPESFRTAFFTPLTCLFRHGWVLRSGLEKFLDKFITYGATNANKNLSMQFKDENGDPKKEYEEGIQNLPISDLERSKFLPEIVSFSHSIDDELMAKLLSYTETIYNGNVESIRNYYFKVEYLNEKGIWERGYIMSVDPKNKGSWKMILSNEGASLEAEVVESIYKPFKCNLEYTECEEGADEYLSTLYFFGDGETPQLGDTIVSDAIGSLLYKNEGFQTLEGGIKTNESGVSIDFTCN